MTLTLGQTISLACLLEVITPKPGNVHRGADFEDLKLDDFMLAAIAVSRPLEAAQATGVGVAVLEAIKATQALTRTNVNLGTVLLLAPLAAVPVFRPLQEGIAGVLDRLNADDAQAIYEAIRISAPGGLGEVDEMDVHDAPPTDILKAMSAAAERDLVARQYTNGFADIFDFAVPVLVADCKSGATLCDAILHTHVRLMAEYPDSLIARKCGANTAERAAALAAHVLAAGISGSEDYLRAVADLDFWLRSDGHRRNPGTTADLVAASLFVALREQLVEPPFR